MITALIRTHPGREVQTAHAVRSCMVARCDFKLYEGEKVNDYSYNLYCNKLKEQITDGYFFFLDSDDYVIPGSIQKIIPHLNPDTALIVQMLRKNRPKPRKAEIKKGNIGMPCMILHHSHKNLADIQATEDADYRWIKAVTDIMPWKFLAIPLVNAGKRSHGK